MTTETQNNHNSAKPPEPTTSEDVAFWAWWWPLSMARFGGAVFAAMPWLVLAVSLAGLETHNQ